MLRRELLRRIGLLPLGRFGWLAGWRGRERCGGRIPTKTAESDKTITCKWKDSECKMSGCYCSPTCDLNSVSILNVKHPVSHKDLRAACAKWNMSMDQTVDFMVYNVRLAVSWAIHNQLGFDYPDWAIPTGKGIYSCGDVWSCWLRYCDGVHLRLETPWGNHRFCLSFVKDVAHYYHVSLEEAGKLIVDREAESREAMVSLMREVRQISPGRNER